MSRNIVVDSSYIPLEVTYAINLLTVKELLAPLILLMLKGGISRYEIAQKLGIRDSEVRTIGQCHGILK